LKGTWITVLTIKILGLVFEFRTIKIFSITIVFSGAQRQDKGQWTQTEAEEVPSEHEEELLHSEGDGALE